MADLRNRKPGWRRCRRLWTSNGRGVPQGRASARDLKPNGLQQSCWLDAWACEGGHADTPPILLASPDGVSMAYMSRTCLVHPMWIAIHMGCTRQVRDMYAMDTPSGLASSMGGVSACPPSHAHASSQQDCCKPLGFKSLALARPCGTPRPLLVHSLRHRRQPGFRFRKSANPFRPHCVPKLISSLNFQEVLSGTHAKRIKFFVAAEGCSNGSRPLSRDKKLG